MKMKRRIKLILIFGIGGIIVGGLAITGRLSAAGQRLQPGGQASLTARVQRGDIEVDVITSGEFQAPHSAVLTAPPVNGTLQIVSMLGTGSKVHAGDVVVEFDPSEQEYNFEQNNSQLRQAEQDIRKARADAAVQAAQDETTLLTARFDVRRAELEVQKNELVSDIDARKNNLALVEAQRHLKQTEQDAKSRSASGEANLKVMEERRKAAQLAMQVAQQNIENMKIKAPIDGILSVKENHDASGGFPGTVVPEYRAGDLTYPGRPLAEVLDVSQMEVHAKINENDRANIVPNQPADIEVDAHAGHIFSAKVKSVAGMVSRNFWEANSSGQFDATFQLDQSSPELRPGVTTIVTVHGGRLKNVLYLPRQCLFEKDGKQLVYVYRGAGFQPVEVKVKYRTEDRIVIEGLAEGTEAALVNPNSTPARKAAGKDALAAAQ